MGRTFVKGLWTRKRRLASTSIAVVLGIAFLVASLSLGDTLQAGFEDMFTDANSGTAVVVRSANEAGTGDVRQRGTLPAALDARIAELDGVAAVTPVIEGTGQILDAGGDALGGNGPPTLAGNWIDTSALNPYRIAEGRAPADAGDGAPFEVVIDARSADEGGLAVGDHTQVKAPDPVEVVVVGVATFGKADSMGPVTFAGFTEDVAQQLFARPGEVQGFRVESEPGLSENRLRAAVAAVLPADAEALTGAELTAEQMDDIRSDFLTMFNGMLLAFAGVAVVVAAFSIHNTFAIVVAQRTRESALLRAIGATRRQVLGSVIGEALAVGVVASALGIAAGFGLTSGLKALIAARGIDLGYDGVEFTPATMAVAAVVGIVVTLLASLVPAVRASRVAPLEALRASAIDSSASSKVRAVAGALLVAGGVAIVATAASQSDGALGRAGVGALLTVVGVVVIGPIIARPVAAVLGTPAALVSHNGRLGRGNAVRNPRRTAGSAAALMVGTAVVALFSTFGSSIKAAIDQSVDRDFTGDLVIIDSNFSGAGISPAVAPALVELPEVTAAVGMALGAMTVDGRGEAPSVIDPAGLAAVFDLDVQQGSLADVGPGELAISTSYAEDHALTIGSTVEAGYADGSTQQMAVGAIYGERLTWGDVIVNPADWAPHRVASGDVVVLVTLADGVSEADGAAAVDAVSARYAAPDAQTREEYKDTVAGEIDAMLALVYGLLGVAVLIALMGIANTLSLSIYDRTHELGLLRAVGQTRRQLKSTIRWESAITAVFGTIVGLGLGTFLGWGIVRALAAQEGIGVWAAPTGTLVVVLVLAAVAGVAASLRPARRAARLDILDAIATS